MAYQLFNVPPQQPLSAAGRILSGCKASFFLTNSSTPADVYTTSALDVAHTQPVEADAAGRFDAIYLDPEVTYKVTITDANDVLLYTIDPCNDQLLSQALIGEYLYPKTAAETSAAATIENYAFPPGDVRRYGAKVDGATDDHAALNRAIAQCVQDGGAAVYVPGFLAVGSAVTLLPFVTIYGDGPDASGIYGLANTFSLLIDNNTAVTDLVIEDLLFEAVSIGGSNRAIFLDADTASVSERIKIRRCKFQSMFRPINIHRGDDVEIDDIEATDVGSSVIYIGVSVAGGRSSDVRVSNILGYDIDTTPDAAGSGAVCIHYADGVRVNNVKVRDVGMAGDTHHHTLYLRDVTDVKVGDISGAPQLGGAVVHVFSDVGGGESRSENVTVSRIHAIDLPDYAAVRIDEVNNLILSDVIAENGATQALYLSNISGMQCSNITAKNNNQDGLSGTDNAACWLEDIVSASFANVTGTEDSVGANTYGQSTLFAFHGSNEDVHLANCRNSFTGTAGFGYYGIEITSGATLTRFSVNGFIQIGASNAFHETGVATEGLFNNLSLTGTGSTTPFSTVQLHKFAVKNVFVAGVPWVYESESGYIKARLAAAPTAGTWKRGDIVWNTNFTAVTSPGWGCITSGTFSAATDSTGDTDGSTAVITGVGDTSDFFVGEYVTVSAGFASTGPHQIVAKTATSITVNANSNSAQSNVTIATPDPTFGAMAALT